MGKKRNRSRVGFAIEGEFVKRDELIKIVFESLERDIEYLRKGAFSEEEKKRIQNLFMRMERLEEEMSSLDEDVYDL